MKNKLGIVFVLGMATAFDPTNAMGKEDPFAHLDPFKTDQEVMNILKEKQNKPISKANHPSDASIPGSNQVDFLDLTGSPSDTSKASLSPVSKPVDFWDERSLPTPNTQKVIRADSSDLIDLSDGTLTDSLSSVPELQNSKESTDSSKSSLSNSKFIITIVPAGSKPSSLGNSVKLPKQPAFNEESKGKSASIDFSDLRRKSRFEVSIKPANYADLHGLPKQAPLANRFKITRSQASNPGKEPNF